MGGGKQNASVKENILFGRPYDETWYRSVIHACALASDIKDLVQVLNVQTDVVVGLLFIIFALEEVVIAIREMKLKSEKRE